MTDKEIMKRLNEITSNVLVRYVKSMHGKVEGRYTQFDLSRELNQLANDVVD